MSIKYSRLFFVVILALIAGLSFFTPAGQVKAAVFQNADTVSTEGIEFTDVEPAKPEVKTETTTVKPSTKEAASAITAVKPAEKPKTLWQIFIEGFLGGFAALIMPCIYPLLPLTVSFFTKKAGSRSKGIMHSLIYGISIIVIYVALGLIITLIFGSDALNELATSGVFNLFFFLLLVVFGISFLGAFELQLPSSLANKLDANSDKGGIAGIFFMAATLAVVSFSCTGPIIGYLLVEATSKGERLAPIMGMLGFSSALAIPFTIFALFPSLLKSLPKSGGWLNSVKVVLGFLELAFALKFLSGVDLAYHWNWFDREVFLSLWIALGLLMFLYLIGKIKFSHDSDLPYLSVPRTFIAIGVLAFTLYMVPGLWGAPLKVISGFLPPPATQDFMLSNDGTSGNQIAQSPAVSIKQKKHENLFTRGKHAGLNEWYDMEQALQVSKELNKPVLIDFTGWFCANCRKMENEVWSDPQVHKRLAEDYILLELYVDEKAELPKNEQHVSDFSGKTIKTIGNKWSDYEASKFNVNSQPYYVIVNAKGDVLVPPQGANYNVNNYIEFLDSGKAAYEKNNGRD
ncbi:protein-disulfide reductase DsbD family protein [Mucilaginibacter aquatilis]|uniref:Thioredoxin fold domain-containing protein n=1 Tax=Mucilaginibacter aquatilis TaxID=1517760 RepID=A0A6I4I7R8_9SPHI|nr:thioredoxin family protein [Mucilaginibacter aquatilis]MVN90947.1 thioredoxin fold domain-containing protein [Mucilaginibacter aquatilis]